MLMRSFAKTETWECLVAFVTALLTVTIGTLTGLLPKMIELLLELVSKKP